MNQLVQPNLSVQGKAGWCLWFAEEVFATPHLYDTAHDAWLAAKYKHPGEQPPEAAVPVFWTYYDYRDGVWYGHIATWVPGRGVFSSPLNVKFGSEWYPSIEAMTNRLNQIPQAQSSYLGWSEDLANVKIVEGVDMSPTRRPRTPDECVADFKNFAGRDDVKASDPVCQNRFIDPESDEFFYGLLVHVRDLRIANEQRAINAESEVTRLTTENEALKKQLSEAGQNPDSVTVTKSSLWDWFKNLPFIKKG